MPIDDPSDFDPDCDPNMSFAEWDEEVARPLTAAKVTYLVDTAQFNANREQAKERASKGDQFLAVSQAYEDCAGLAQLKTVGQAPLDTTDRFTALRAAFPNFEHFINEVEGACHRALLRKTRDLTDLKLLLLGPPGIGKTQVVEALAALLDFECERLHMNSQTASFEFKGLGGMWSNPSPGAVARLFARSRYANPIILLDEIDKGAPDARQFGRSLDALLELAEPSTASRWRDECLRVDVDTSRALLIATANDTETLSEALLSRFVVVEACAPTKEQMSQVVQAIYHDLIGDDVELFERALSSEVAAAVAMDSPRNARLRLKRAMNNAAARVVTPPGAPRPIVRIEPRDLPLQDRRSRAPFGFIPA